MKTALLETDYIALLGSTADRMENQERFLDTMRERSTDGVILCPARGTPAETIEQLSPQLPTVQITRYVAGVDVDYIGTDNELGARRATEHLTERGHRRIASIGGANDSSARQDRLRGLISILEKYLIPLNQDLMVTGDLTRNGGYTAIQKVYCSDDPPTAVLCYIDVVAIGVMLGLRRCKLEPGRDVAVVGFDVVCEASLWNPPLSSVSATPTQIGQHAVSLILKQIEHPDLPTRQVILPSTLTIRASSKSGCSIPNKTTTLSM